MMMQYGVMDLFNHVLYVNKTEDIKTINRGSASRVLLLSLAVCYEAGYDVRYDMLFQKTPYGAYNSDVDAIARRGSYSYFISLKNAKEIPELTRDEKVHRRIVGILKTSVNNRDKIIHVITSTPEYHKDQEEVWRVYEEESNLYFKDYPYWSKEDIATIFMEDSETPKVNTTSKVPLRKRDYDITVKYLESGSRPVEFRSSELMRLHNMPYYLLKSAEEHGCYYEPKLDYGG